MPWLPRDAKRHTKRASSGKKSRRWSHVANSALARGQSEGSAIRQANAVVAGKAKHRGGRKTVKKRRPGRQTARKRSRR